MGRDHPSPPTLADQLTLSKRGRQIMQTTLLLPQPDFQTFLRPCIVSASCDLPTYVKYPYIGSCDDGPQQPHVCFFSPSFGSYWEETWRPIEKGHGLILDLFHRFSIIIIKSRKNSSNANISSPLYTRTQSGDIISDFAFYCTCGFYENTKEVTEYLFV